MSNNVAGIVTGLAWTSVGGEILFIESSISEGKRKPFYNWKLRKIMKESAIIAIGIHKVKSKELGIEKDLDFSKYNIHIHVPEGELQKMDLAGITI